MTQRSSLPASIAVGTPNPGALLRGVRTACGFTQTEVARLAAVDQSIISRIETGYLSPTVDELDRILRTMGKRIILTHRRVKRTADV